MPFLSHSADLVLSLIGFLFGAFFFSKYFQVLYRKMPAPWNLAFVIMMHLMGCTLVAGCFLGIFQLNGLEISNHYFSPQAVRYGAAFALLFMLGIPVVYFYIRAESALNRLAAEKEALEKEDHAHKLDVLNFMSRIMDELPETLKDNAAKTSVLVKEFCQFLKMEPEMEQDIVFAAMFHDAGAAFGGKPHTLDARIPENDRHAELGEALLSKMSLYKNAALIVRHHHEWWDGTGTPDRLKGISIPLGSRIIAIASAYVHLCAAHGKTKPNPQDVLEKLNVDRGVKFCPDLLDQFNTCMTTSLGAKSFGDRTEFR